MSRLLFAGVIAGAVMLGPLQAPRAEVIDMAAVTCGDLLDMNADDAGSVLLWTHGYFGGLANDTKVDLHGFKEAAKVIGEYCAKHKKVTLISAIKDLSN
jgi:hypothetical protein